MFRGVITCMHRRVPKGEKKTIWPLFRTVCVMPYFCSCYLLPFLGSGGVFVGGKMCICVPLRVLISRACSNNICCDTAFFELVCLLHQSYLRCLDSLMILLQCHIGAPCMVPWQLYNDVTIIRYTLLNSKILHVDWPKWQPMNCALWYLKTVLTCSIK